MNLMCFISVKINQYCKHTQLLYGHFSSSVGNRTVPKGLNKSAIGGVVFFRQDPFLDAYTTVPKY